MAISCEAQPDNTAKTAEATMTELKGKLKLNLYLINIFISIKIHFLNGWHCNQSYSVNIIEMVKLDNFVFDFSFFLS